MLPEIDFVADNRGDDKALLEDVGSHLINNEQKIAETEPNLNEPVDLEGSQAQVYLDTLPADASKSIKKQEKLLNFAKGQNRSVLPFYHPDGANHPDGADEELLRTVAPMTEL